MDFYACILVLAISGGFYLFLNEPRIPTNIEIIGNGLPFKRFREVLKRVPGRHGEF